MKAFLVLGAVSAIKFVESSDEIESTGQRLAQQPVSQILGEVEKEEENQGSTGVGYNVGVRFVNADAERPGWSSTRGAMTIMNDSAGPEYHNEMGQEPCNNTPAELEKLQESWMQDPKKDDVTKRLDVLDQDAYVKYNAN